ncbi:LacI family transcriptional regulator [Kitasatospora sp. NBC_01246]|uniref:LacI family DNA-binding transcriptional regulator n=1 Tax=Kitasatospora sp. NBC_01246 TaxID=2903570 RepID=UPI002E3799D8|nr:LacI family DNA-binding transcriptional regulator [Kitasatospora sp. NBC_01246]
MAVTLADVARRSGTSTAVVSYVMNNGPRPVAPATRERVLKAAAELGYRPNRIARALRSRTSGVVGLVLADASNPYFGALARHVERVLEEHDKLTLTGNAGYAADRQEHLVERFLAAQVDGLIIVSGDGGSDVAAEASAAGVPSVYVHNAPAGARTPAVAADNDDAVRAAVAHLRDTHGLREIAFLAGPRDAGPVGLRQEAWRRSMADLDGEPLLLRCDYARAAAADLIAGLAAEGSLPRALVAATDEQAIGVLAAAFTAGVRVPEDLAVISLDGAPESAYTAPSLTVTSQPLKAMAERAVALLLGNAAHPHTPGADLVVRGSCGCPAGR